MQVSLYSAITAILTLALGAAASAAKPPQTQTGSAIVRDGGNATGYCHGLPSDDGLFQLLAGGRVCIASALKDSVVTPMEKVALSAVAASYLSASQTRSNRPLPLPLQLLGSMVADNVTTNLEARHASPVLPRQSPLAARDFPSNEREPVNWAAIGLARAQAAGSCEAVTVGLFKKLAHDANLSVSQRAEAGQILRAFGIANLHPDDRCVS